MGTDNLVTIRTAVRAELADVSITGTHDGCASDAILTDSAGNFIERGVQIGDTIINDTDGSVSTIVSFTATTITAPLAGGTEDDWDVGDVYVIQKFTTDIIDQAVSEVVSDISRLAPRELLHIEVLHTRTVTAEVVIANSDIWVNLANKPIETQSTVIITDSGATVTYVEYTDYIIDYTQGRIQVLSTGSICDCDSLRATYEKSLKGIDISSITDLISIERVEYYPTGGTMVQNFESWSRWGDILWLNSKQGNTQTNLAENDYIYIWYKAEHTKPSASTAGSHPAFLDDVVVKGAVAYSLFSKHRERNLQALTYHALSRNALAQADADQTDIDTSITAVNTALDAMNTALDLVNTLASTPLADAELALDSSKAINLLLNSLANSPYAEAALALDVMKVTLDKVNDVSKVPLLDATTAAAAANTVLDLIDQLTVDGPFFDADTALDSAKVALALTDAAADPLSISITASIDNMETILAQLDIFATCPPNVLVDNIETTLDAAAAETAKAFAILSNANVTDIDELVKTAINLANNILKASGGVDLALDKIEDHLETDTIGVDGQDSAENQLAAGDSLINAVNTGAGVAELYAKYGEVQTIIASGFNTEARQRIDQSLALLQEASTRIAQKQVSLSEAQGNVNTANSYNNEAGLRIQFVEALRSVGEAYGQAATERRNQLLSIQSAAAGFTQEAGGRIAIASNITNVALGFIQESSARIAIAAQLTQTASGYAQESSSHVDIANSIIQVSNGFIQESTQRIAIASHIVQVGIAYGQEAIARTQLIDRQLSLGNLYINQSRGYLETADRENQNADRFLTDARERHRDYWDHLTNRTEMAANPRVQTSSRQATPLQNP